MNEQKVQTIGELYQFLRRNMATKEELKKTEKSLVELEKAGKEQGENFAKQLRQQEKSFSGKLQKQAETTQKSFRELYCYLDKNMATKQELRKSREETDNLFTSLYGYLQENMVTKKDLKCFATKNDLGALVARIDQMAENRVTNDEFTKFKHGVYNKFDAVIGKLDELKIDDVALKSGLGRLEENVGKS